MIVVSILLAFAIDASWDARSAARDEAALLDAIRADMTTNLEALDRYLGVMEALSQRIDNFLAATPAALGDLEPETAAPLVRAFIVSGTFTPLDGALRTSDLSAIGNLELRTDLGAWLRLVEDAAEDLPILETGAREVAIRSGVAGGPRAMRGQAVFPEVGTANEVLSQLRREVEFIDVLLVHDSKRRRNYDKLVGVRDATKVVLDRLAAYQP